jgi:hypothetical protein
MKSPQPALLGLKLEEGAKVKEPGKFLEAEKRSKQILP